MEEHNEPSSEATDASARIQQALEDALVATGLESLLISQHEEGMIIEIKIEFHIKHTWKNHNNYRSKAHLV